MWAKQAETLARRMIEHFWDAEAGVFWATRNHQPIKLLTPFSLYPLGRDVCPRRWTTGWWLISLIHTILADLADPDCGAF